MVAVLTDGPLRGQRRHIDADHYGRAPERLDVVVAADLTHRYIAVRATARAGHWSYRYEPAAD